MCMQMRQKIYTDNLRMVSKAKLLAYGSLHGAVSKTQTLKPQTADLENTDLKNPYLKNTDLECTKEKQKPLTEQHHREFFVFFLCTCAFKARVGYSLIWFP